MRQALFAVVLVAASFAGGAAVNGPGLRWAQAWALGRLGLVQNGDNPPAGTPTAPVPSPEADGGIPPLAIDTPPADKTNQTAQEPPTNNATGPWAPEPSASGQGQAQTPAADKTNQTAQEPVALADVPALERPEPLALPGDAPEAAAPAPPRGAGEGTIALASLPGRPDPTPTPTEPADWPAVRQALKALGVSRYGTEGEPGGRVRFHCVIPLAGRRAVGQHFEAEGADELQAARAALKRIALWRATEGNP